MTGGDHLGPAMYGTGERPGAGGMSPYLSKPGILPVQTKDVAGVEIAHETSRSRSSEMISVESRPPRRAPLSVSFLNSGLSFRRAKYGTSGADGCLGNNSCSSALSTNVFKLVPCSTARILALRYSGSGMSMVVFMEQYLHKDGFPSIKQLNSRQYMIHRFRRKVQMKTSRFITLRDLRSQ